MAVTCRVRPLRYDVTGSRGVFVLKTFLQLVLVAALAGCAAASPSHGHRGHNEPVAKQAAPSVSPIDSRARHCAALAMYWEARGEGRRGMLAVGAVLLNRVADERFPDTVCGVVYQGGESPPCQFSWWCDGKSDRPTNQALWAKALGVAEDMLTARPTDPTHGALFFHSTSVQPQWRRTRTASIGNHIFYR